MTLGVDNIPCIVTEVGNMSTVVVAIHRVLVA